MTEPQNSESDKSKQTPAPQQSNNFSQKEYHHPAAAWGAAFSVGRIMLEQKQIIGGIQAVFQMNHENGGYDCPGCAWPDDRKGLKMDICENGIKHSTWESTSKRVGPEFFAKHTVTELLEWSDFALENEGRLTEPMKYNSSTDKYEPISWQEAYALIAKHLRALSSPHQASFYTSGRLSNEATFLYQLFCREYGTNNLPDCSNMCHEASGRALKASLGTGKGTTTLVDWQNSDAIFIMGVNAATNTPRMLTALVHGVREHEMKVVHINPLVEVAATSAITPHDILDMLLFKATPTSSLNMQVRIGGDLAVMRGFGKYLLEEAKSDPTVIDKDFITKHTSGFEKYAEACEASSWEEIERQSGLSKQLICGAARIYKESKKSIIAWCLGISQQEYGVDTIREIVNVLLLKGNIGREGAGPCPIRGHSNVQGNRTCGIHNRPPESWLAKMDAACGIKSPREYGYDTVGTIEAMMSGDVKVFMGMGGNFASATPDTQRTFEALRKCVLTFQVSTKLNRSHLVHGKDALILPCLGRTEIDEQAGGVQQVSVEDSMSEVHLSGGIRKPASPQLRSEIAILAGIARATLPQSKTPWEQWTGNYDLIRDKMAQAISGFENFNELVRQPLGFRLPQPARRLVFETDTNLANFSNAPLPDTLPPTGKLMLGTFRSHDQFNTTVYSDNDRYRGVKNLRTLVFMNEGDMRERGLEEFALVDITSYAKDGSTRFVKAYRAVKYNVPKGCAFGYMPELNVLIGIGNYSKQSDQPLMKQIVVDITAHSHSPA